MPRSTAWIQEMFGRFSWSAHHHQRGRILIDDDWIMRNIERLRPGFPITDCHGHVIREIPCHKLIAHQLERVLDDLRRDHLSHLINTFDGCWVPRHMRWNPKRALSHHSWGIAVDINARRFPYGSPDRQDMRLINAFRRHGWEWGGDWSTPDPMHFEIIEVRAQIANRQGVLIVLNDELIASDGRLIEGQLLVPVEPIVNALGGTCSFHPEHGSNGKGYIYIAGAQAGDSQCDS